MRRTAQGLARWSAGIVAVVGAVGLAPAGLRAQGAAEPRAFPDSVLARGREVFTGSANCRSCHGEEARGTEDGPDLTDDRWILGSGTYAEILERVRHGMPRRESSTGRVMPMGGWSAVSDDDLNAVAAYVWSLTGPKAPRE